MKDKFNTKAQNLRSEGGGRLFGFQEYNLEQQNLASSLFQEINEVQKLK